MCPVPETSADMNFLSAPPEQRDDHSPDGSEVDRLLRAFYRSEIPDPWPRFTAPTERVALLPFPTHPARRPLLGRSRLALAASVALLLGGLWSLSGKFSVDPAPKPGPRTLGGSAQ